MLTHIGTQPIETDRLILRRFTAADEADAFRYWAGDPLVQTMYGEPTHETLEAVRTLLERYSAAYEREDVYRWAIDLKGANSCIGQVAYFLVDTKNHFAEIEYCIGRPFQGAGLATEATKAVIDHGFGRIGLHKVQICHKASNDKSRRVIEKCGFKHEGSLRDYFFVDGRYEDRVYYSMLESEHAEIRRGELNKPPVDRRGKTTDKVSRCLLTLLLLNGGDHVELNR